MRKLPLRDMAKFLMLFGFWIILSERFQFRYLAIGALTALAIIILNRNLGLRHSRYRDPGNSRVAWFSFVLGYIPWLVWQVILANIDVAKIVIKRDMQLRPAVLELPLKLKRGVAQVVYANSITLTPGTVTVDIQDDTVIVHALAADAGEGLISHEVHNRIAPYFFEETLDKDAKAVITDSFSPRWVEGGKR